MSSGAQVDFSKWIAATRDPKELQLGIPGFAYADLYQPEKLAALTREFDRFFQEREPEAHARFADYRERLGEGMTPQQVSNALIDAAPHLSAFIAKLFGIEDATLALKESIVADDPVWLFKKDFTKRRVLKPKAGESFTHGAEVAALVSKVALAAVGADKAVFGTGSDDEELAVAKATLALHEVDDTARKAQRAGGAEWTDELRARARSVRAAFMEEPALSGVVAEVVATLSEDPTEDEDHRVVVFALDAIEAFLARRMRDRNDLASRWPSLHTPERLNHADLVQLRRPDEKLPELFVGPEEGRRERGSFVLSDRRSRQRKVLGEIDYCILCHDRDKDSCSKGMPDPKSGELRKNPLGVELAGCPLCEKISEMHLMKKQGDSLASLALICIDNPMAPGTGHRICNDCMKGCIFQKQDPVNIPEIETSVVTDVLDLPWGVEIYGLLTRWNPLNVERPHALPYNGKNVLVVGLGPAGYTLAHHLTREGFGVAAIDGLKIEPLPVELTGSDEQTPRPIKNFKDLYVELDERILLGFGGVSEYGITVRWDKNFLTLLYLTLSRQRLLRMYGGVRFGGTITLEDAWELGFDHVAIAVGAGKPTLIGIKNNLARGIRKASDFLMALQLSGAYKQSSLASLQVRLPAIVIGGGLTAVDTATELLAYYVVQIEKTAARLNALIREKGEEAVAAGYDAEEWAFLKEQLAHAKELAEERQLAEAERREPRVQDLLDKWGGVSLVYRKSVKDSPAYRLNHEEVIKSLEEGLRYIENLSPTEAILDEYNAVSALRFERQAEIDGRFRGTGEMVDLPARTVCIAAGTSPNIIYEKERPGTFQLDSWQQYFQAHRAFLKEDGTVAVEPVSNPREGFFTSYCDGKRTVSYYGDNHPHYAGSIVKAMASAKDGFPHVAALFEREIQADTTPQGEREQKLAGLFGKLDHELKAYVHEVNRLTRAIVEVVVRAPAAARKFEPGQFYRLQNFEKDSPMVDGARLAMEGLALTGAWVDKEEGLLSLIVLEMGTSSRLVADLAPGQEVVVMGPTGTPTEIPSGETVMLCGGGLGNAVLFSIAKSMKAQGDKVIYFAGYKDGEDLFKQDDIEIATDQVIWCTDAGKPIEPRRPQDRHFRGNIVQAMIAYAEGEIDGAQIDLSEVSRIIAIGSDRMMAAVKEARHATLAHHLNPNHVGLGSINSPMQCMLKEVCAQCLQKHVDPETGKETVIFSCFNQDQRLDSVDFNHLNTRLRSNTAQEKLSNAWLDRILERRK